MTKSTYMPTSEVAIELKVKPNTVRIWAGNGKQKKIGFPKPKFKSTELQFSREEIRGWANGLRFY